MKNGKFFYYLNGKKIEVTPERYAQEVEAGSLCFARAQFPWAEAHEVKNSKNFKFVHREGDKREGELVAIDRHGEIRRYNWYNGESAFLDSFEDWADFETVKVGQRVKSDTGLCGVVVDISTHANAIAIRMDGEEHFEWWYRLPERFEKRIFRKGDRCITV